MNREKILKAGKIASEVRNWIKPQIKKGTPLIEIVEKIEAQIFKLGGKPAFPTSLSIDETAAHSTPSHDSSEKARGLVKVDFGVSIDGWISDNAFSVDLENSEENKKLIKASEKALANAIKTIKKGIKSREIGKTIQETIESLGFSPIVNLSGHKIEQYDLHAGISIPNFDNSNDLEIPEGLYAIEPFATLSTGSGKVKDGKPSGIYMLTEEKNIRNPTAKEILGFIIEEYQTLPFCSRWIVKKFGTRALIALNQLEENGNLHHFAQLIESSKNKVSQTEHTILVEKDKIIVTTA